jgi:hypothetical protein
MHGAQRLGCMRLQQSFLKIEPQFAPSRRSDCQSRQSLLNPVLRGRTQFQSMSRHEVKKAQQHLVILQRRRLLQEDKPIDHRKIGARGARFQDLKWPSHGRPGLRNLLHQLCHCPLDGAGMTKINSHPVGRRQIVCVWSANFSRSGFVLSLPA